MNQVITIQHHYDVFDKIIESRYDEETSRYNPITKEESLDEIISEVVSYEDEEIYAIELDDYNINVSYKDDYKLDNVDDAQSIHINEDVKLINDDKITESYSIADDEDDYNEDDEKKAHYEAVMSLIHDHDFESFNNNHYYDYNFTKESINKKIAELNVECEKDNEELTLPFVKL